MARSSLVLLAVVVLAFCLVQVRGDFATTMTSLRNTLIGNTSAYEKTVRPDTFVTINLENVLRHLLKLDISGESMMMYMVWNMAWKDSRLAWTPADWDNITMIYLSSESIWCLPLIVDNAIDNGNTVECTGNALVTYDGTVVAAFPTTLTTRCDVSIKHYPFDEQTCQVRILLWGMTMHYALNLSSPAVYTGLFQASAEWQFMENTAVQGVIARDATMSMPEVTYSFRFRRLIPYYCLAMIVPILMLMCLVLTIFKVPIESGEKLGYCLTLLLNFVVLLTILSDQLPPLARDINILQVLLGMAMATSVMATMLTILVLHLYHKEASEPVPGWVTSFTRFVQGPCKGRTCKNKTHSTARSEKQAEGDDIGDVGPWVSTEVTWQMAAKALDQLCLWIFLGVKAIMVLALMVAITERHW